MPFPQHPNKHREPPLFTASEFRRYERRQGGARTPPPPPSVVMVFGRRWERYLARRYRAGPEARSDVYRENDRVGVAHVSGPGAPHATIVFEELSALGVRRFLLVGLAGSLQPDLRVGEWVLCTKALRDEGTSHHYVGPGVYSRPSAGLTADVRSELRRHRMPFVEGPTWTIDAVYRETRAEVRRYRARGIRTVDMEASAIFSVARCRRRQAAALFVVSDHLDEGGWEPRFYDTGPPLRRAFEFGLAALGRSAAR